MKNYYTHSFFFNSPAYVQYQLSKNTNIQFQLFEVTDGKNTITCPLFYDKETAFNPLRATFGGIEVKGLFQENLMQELLQKVNKFAEQNALKSIQIAMYPEKYAPEMVATIHSVLLQQGFQVLYEDQTAMIEVNDTDLKEKMHRGEKHKLNKAQRAGFVCEQLADYMLPLVYPLIVAARQAKGYPITLQQTQLADLLQQFPQQYRLFGVWSKNSELAATAVCVQVHRHILYTFYIGDLLKFRSFSPVVLLHQGIYDYCLQNDIHWLDLGIGTEKGVLNTPLMQFKQNLGAEMSQKITYVIQSYEL